MATSAPQWDPATNTLQVYKYQIKYERKMSSNLIVTARHEICQKIYMTGFSGQKFYTLKRRKLRLFLVKKQQRKCINIIHCSSFLLELN